ncbi:MAG: tetratricopeptide repeat protein [Planctomycetota bacterium]
MPGTDLRERRTVSVLFSDLTGFTRLSEGLDPEEVSDIVDALFRRFRTVIEREGGTVDKFIGDAVMAVFGAPAAHEDDAARAVRAGLAMQKDLLAFNGERGLSLAMRVGVNTGEVLWGTVGGGAPTAMGDPVNVAQRLESAALPGTVLIGTETESAVRRRFRCTARDPVTVKGREAKVAAFEVEEELASMTEVRPAREAPMVGRSEELAALVALLESGGPGFVVIEGEAGTGKSRLLAEFRRSARDRRFRVEFGRSPDGARMPLAPFADMLRATAGSTDATAVVAATQEALASLPPVDAENTAHLLALSAGWTIPGARVLQLDPERRAAETAAAWARWIRARSPVLVCVEDLHWADDATRALLTALPSLLAGARVVVATSTRPGSPPIAGFGSIRLLALSSDDVRAIAQDVLGVPPDDGLARFITDYAGGNPYCGAEVARHLLDSRLIEGSPAHLHGSVAGLPATLHGILTARLDALPAPSKEALKAASVLGRTFWRGLLGEILGASANEALEEPKRRGLVFARAGALLPGDDAMMFQHALLRDAAYALLPRKERQRLHARAADQLEKRAGHADRRLRALAAEHRKDAGESDAAGKLWLGAAREAMDNAVEEALAWALESRRAKPGADAALLAATAAFRLARYTEADAYAKEALSDPGASPDARQRAHVRLAETNATTGKQVEALANLDALAGLEATPGIELAAESVRVLALASLGRAQEALSTLERLETRHPATAPLLRTRSSLLRRLGRLVDSERAAEQAILLSEKTGDRNSEALSLTELAGALAARGLQEQSVALNRRAQELWREIGNRRGHIISLHNIGTALRHLGKYEQAASQLAEALELARESGDSHAIATVLGSASMVASAQGLFPGALAFAREAVAIRRTSGEKSALAIALNNLAVAHDWLGEWDKAEAAYRESLALRRETGSRNGEARCLNNIGLIEICMGRFAEAGTNLSEALSIAQETSDLDTEACVRVNDAKLQRSLGNLDSSLANASLALETFRSLKNPEAVAEALNELARTRMLRGEWAGAREAAEEALSTNRGIASRQGIAASLAVLGTVEHAAGQVLKAEGLLEESVALARAVGDRHTLATAQKRLASLHATSGRILEAESLLADTLEIERSLGALPGIAGTLDVLGQVRGVLGNLHEADASLRESAEIRRRIGDRAGLAASLQAEGGTLARLGEFGKAGAVLEEALALNRELRNPRGEGISLAELGNLRLEEKRDREAIPMLRESLALVRIHGDASIIAHVLTSLSSALKATGDAGGAANLLAEAVELSRRAGDRNVLARTLLNIAIGLGESGRHADALAPAHEALEHFRQLGNARGAAAAHLRIGRFQAALGRHAEARAALEEAATGFAALLLDREAAEARRAIELLPRA